MNHLVPCGGCDRHVRASEASCPFCGAAIDAARPVPGMPDRRLGRAATFAFGAALAAASATGCSDSHTPDDDAGGTVQDAGDIVEDAGHDAGFDAGAVAPPYGLPPDDAGFAPLYGGSPGD